MTHLHHGKRLTIQSPANYRIHVKGYLNSNLSNRLCGMRITSLGPSDQNPMTTIEGRVTDQAELIGMLSNLSEMNLSILTVELLSIE